MQSSCQCYNAKQSLCGGKLFSYTLISRWMFVVRSMGAGPPPRVEVPPERRGGRNVHQPGPVAGGPGQVEGRRAAVHRSGRARPGDHHVQEPSPF